MRTITLTEGAASIEGDKIVVVAVQEGSNEQVKVEIPVAIVSVMQEAAKAHGKKKGGDA